MALEGILTPEQAERAKVMVWRGRGVHALLDPELAARLNLSKAQRAEITDAVRGRLRTYHRLIRSGVVFARSQPPAVLAALQRQREEEVAQKVAELDQPIWEILAPSQLRALARLVNKPVAGYDPRKSKANAKRDGREG
jgi:hypothetical protein